jgi:putative flippase GtrA
MKEHAEATSHMTFPNMFVDFALGRRSFLNATQDLERSAHDFQDTKDTAVPVWSNLRRQLIRFAMVGGLNTAIDLVILNALLWLFPTQDTLLLLVYNSLAYLTGAVNSFFLNKYWTFRNGEKTNRGQVLRFSVTTLAGVTCNNVILWLVSTYIHPLIANTSVWANISKIIAIGGTVLISFVGMRLWVFVKHSQKEKTMQQTAFQEQFNRTDSERAEKKTHPLGRRSSHATQPLSAQQEEAIVARERQRMDCSASRQSLSVVLPAHNEEQIIASTVSRVLEVLSGWMSDFEVIVVNDGSTDQTGVIVAFLAQRDPRVRLVTHEVNQGYGAALVSGFSAASKELTFFMDSDGQFDIRELKGFFPFIEEYDAVIGYRIDRQDSWMRKLNAWCWKQVIRLVLGVHVRDIDCAFKLLHTKFLHQHPLETRGAMINAELLYKLAQSGCTYREIGVHHLPRLSGRATGAQPAVIVRALRELFVYARKWKREEHQQIQKLIKAQV